MVKKSCVIRIDRELAELLRDFTLELSLRHKRNYSICDASKILARELKRKPLLKMLKEYEHDSEPIKIKSFMGI